MKQASQHRKQDFPAFLDMRGRRVVVVGGGANAQRKLKRLARSGAHIKLISEQLNPELLASVQSSSIDYIQRAWQHEDFKNVALVVAASDDKIVNRTVADAAEQAGCWVNVANQHALSSLLTPSLIDRYPLLIAVSSSGRSPLLARLLTARINAFLPHSYSEIAKLAERYRHKFRTGMSSWRQRRRVPQHPSDDELKHAILQDPLSTPEETKARDIHAHHRSANEGEVYLVGAGPGDPDLLSFRALRFMQQCDVVLYDRLVSEPIMSLVNGQAEKIYVGKRRSHHAVEQDSINTLLVKHAKQGRRVLRLKGGDPFIFGRGGEEIETLTSEGVAFQVVPGITAAAGCASYAGIPLTHRDHAQSCLFVTGHLKDGSVDLDWPALTRARQTVVIYMGLEGLAHICQQLIEHGLPDSHPVAIISQGTLSQQQVITGTLACLPERVKQSTIKAPTLTIVGHVVSLRNTLAWFESHT